jgi:hypothetical protein
LSLTKADHDACEWYTHLRCFELVKVQWKHIAMLDPTAVCSVVRKYLLKQRLVESDLKVHFEVHLVNRKGWQRRVDKGEANLKGSYRLGCHTIGCC